MPVSRVRNGLRPDWRRDLRRGAGARGQRLYGTSVVLASRVAGAASGGEILVSAVIRELTESAGDIRFDAGREIVLKGFEGTRRVYPVCVG
jgi:adenylate cyclase